MIELNVKRWNMRWQEAWSMSSRRPTIESCPASHHRNFSVKKKSVSRYHYYEWYVVHADVSVARIYDQLSYAFLMVRWFWTFNWGSERIRCKSIWEQIDIKSRCFNWQWSRGNKTVTTPSAFGLKLRMTNLFWWVIIFWTINYIHKYDDNSAFLFRIKIIDSRGFRYRCLLESCAPT